MEHNDGKEIMETKFDEVPGYKKVFYVAFATGVAYLLWAFTYGSHFFNSGGAVH